MKWLLLLLLIPIAFSAEFPKEIKVNYNVSTFCIPVFSNVTETIEIVFRGMQRIEKVEPCRVNYFCYENFAKEIGKEYAYINGTRITIYFGDYSSTEYELNIFKYICRLNEDIISHYIKMYGIDDKNIRKPEKITIVYVNDTEMYIFASDTTIKEYVYIYYLLVFVIISLLALTFIYIKKKLLI